MRANPLLATTPPLAGGFGASSDLSSDTTGGLSPLTLRHEA